MNAESAKGGWQHPSTYATYPPREARRRRRAGVRMTLEVKSPKFSVKKRNTKVALCVQFTRGVSSLHVF